MKKFLSLLLAFMLVFSCTCIITVSAASPVYVTIDNIRQRYEVSPMLVDGRTLVPVRPIFESLGAVVKWDEATKMITGKTDDKTVILTVDSKDASVNDEKIKLDVPAQIIDSHTFVPARFVAETLDCEVEWIANSLEKTVAIKTGKAYQHAVPQTPQEEAVIKRVQLICDFEWTPKDNIPTRMSSVTKTFKPGEKYKGLVYSSCEVNDKFITENVSLETYLSALANPDSVIYTKQLSAMATADAYYGMVCNGLVRYALGIKVRNIVDTFHDIPGMEKVVEKGTYTADDLKLCDVLNKPNGHVAIITDILKDESGEVIAVEIADATRPVSRRVVWDRAYIDEPGSWGSNYHIYRYDLSRVPLFSEKDEADYKIVYESDIATKDPLLAIDYGTKSNYLAGEETVISVFAEGENVVEVYKNGELASEIKVEDYARFGRKFGKGYYELRLKGTDESVEFCVCDPEISYTVDGNMITVTASSGDEKSVISHTDFRDAIAWGFVSGSELTEEEIKTGVFTREIPVLKNGHPVGVKVYFENEYGIWCRPFTKIEQ